MGFVTFYVFAFVYLHKALFVDLYFCKMSHILATVNSFATFGSDVCFFSRSYEVIDELT